MTDLWFSRYSERLEMMILQMDYRQIDQHTRTSRRLEHLGDRVAHHHSYTTTALNDLAFGVSAMSIRNSIWFTGACTPRVGSDCGSQFLANISPPAYRLRCPPDCACRCHRPSSMPIVPAALQPIIGQLFLPRRILHALRLSPWECNVQTCRRDWGESSCVSWVRPWWLVE